MDPEASLGQIVFDAIPIAVFMVDDDVRIHHMNAAAAAFCGEDERTVYKKRGGEVFRCLRATDSPEGCGHGPDCGTCVVRNSVAKCLAGQTVTRNQMNLHVRKDSAVRELVLLITASPLPGEDKRAIIMVEDITEITALRGIIPICMHCRKVRDDQRFWKNLEAYLAETAGVDFTHGLCPDCLDEFYPKDDESNSR